MPATHILTHKRFYSGPKLELVKPGTRLSLSDEQAKKMGSKVMAIGDETVMELNDEVHASDPAKSLAEENDIDLASVTGTGKNGNITKGDVQAVIDAAE